MKTKSMRKLIVASCLLLFAEPVLAQSRGKATPVPVAPPTATPSPPDTSSLLPLPTNADLAFGAYQRGEYKVAMREAKARLTKNSNDTAAMTLIGLLYENGWGVLPDLKIAREWYQNAAKKGDTNAMTSLGMMALFGRGMDEDFSLAKAWFEKAVEKNDPLASHNLSLILFRSKLASDEQKAIKLLKVAANAGIISAQHDLAVAYLKGRGIEKSEENAAIWFKKAADWGNTPSEVEYAILLFNGQGVKRDETMAAKVFLRAAYKGNAVAQNRIARLYLWGRGLPKDLTEAAAWHQVASMKGLTDPTLNSELRNLSNDEIERSDRLAQQRLFLK